MAGVTVGDAEQINCGQWQQPQGFEQHPGLRFHGDFLTYQAIKRKAKRQPQRDDRQRAEGPQLDQHAAERQENGQPLHPAEAFAEEQHPENDIHQRVNEVAEARLQHVVVIHRPDKQQPVTAN
ncbi:hypothetical protein D3C85_1558170 [compost metagenome]